MGPQIYAVAISAQQTGEGNSTYTQEPRLITASSSADAVRQAEFVCEQTWTPEEGWTGHSAVLVPISRDFGADAVRIIRDGSDPFVDRPERLEEHFDLRC